MKKTCLFTILIVSGLALSSPVVGGRRGDLSQLPPTHGPLDGKRASAQELQPREYRFALTDGGAWTAANRAQNLRVVVSGSGIEVASSSEDGEASRLTLGLSAYGRQGCLEPVPGVAPQANGNRVELSRTGIVEWYVNDADGSQPLRP